MFSFVQEHFTAEMQPHYIYSPREMTRWVKGVGSALNQLEFCEPEMLVRIWAHEGLRLFSDRLVYDEERKWTSEHIDSVAEEHFGRVGIDVKRVCLLCALPLMAGPRASHPLHGLAH